ncbi:MAG: efflux RND transporter periplasmic adaptor subunit [Thermodesulfobacteriota bacterium]|nr:efflux RND transporter periplasmic adaptor subunit [Thermodesulfobacteriota bacterium]
MENEKGKKGKKGFAIAVIAIFIFSGIIVFNVFKFITKKNIEVQKDESIPVQITESKLMNLDWALEQTGTIRPMSEVNVHPKVPGKIIQTLSVEKGDYIEKGTHIATLEDDTIKAQIEETKAGLDSAIANLKQVEANLEVIAMDRLRLESLYKEKAVAKQRLDHMEAKYKATLQAKSLAEAQIKRTEAVLKRLEIIHHDHKIYAPISGYVSARYMDKGSMSSVQQPIVRISDDREVKIITTATERDVPHIKKGMRVEIQVDAFPERIFPGKISIVNPTVDPVTHTCDIEIHISNKYLTIKSGMFARVRLYVGQKSALVVPRDALNRFPGTGSYYVYTVEDGKAILKNVKTGQSQGNNIELTSGLKLGEKVVVKGQNRLKDGTTVLIEDLREGAEDQGRTQK